MKPYSSSQRTTYRLGWGIAATALVVLMLATTAWARSLTKVTATVRDASGNPYIGGSGNIGFVEPPGADEITKLYECDEGGPGGPFQRQYPIVKFDSFGKFEMELPDNGCIRPAGSKWRFRLCDATGKICFVVDITITGATQDISDALQAAAVPLGAIPAGEVPGDLIPATSGFNLGSAAKRWDLFAGDLDVTGSVAGVVPTSRSVNTASPLTGGGTLTADLTLSMPAAGGALNGYLRSADWSTFNSKQPGDADLSAIAALSTTGFGRRTGADTWALAGASGTGSCTNQFVTATNDAAAPTCTTATLASAQFANQGTTTTVLHGNASGNPSWGAVAVGHVVAALKTRQFGYLAGADSSTAVLADTDDQPSIFYNYLGQGITVTGVWCESDAGTPTIQLQKDDGSPTNMLSANLSCTTTGASTTSFVSGENAIASTNKVDFLIVAAGGTAKRVVVHVAYVLD